MTKPITHIMKHNMTAGAICGYNRKNMDGTNWLKFATCPKCIKLRTRPMIVRKGVR